MHHLLQPRLLLFRIAVYPLIQSTYAYFVIFHILSSMESSDGILFVESDFLKVRQLIAAKAQTVLSISFSVILIISDTL
ncbi:uncharacterized protein BYT42DRAFT_556023 [Radiomyces spectabilis]|uniref:uncharacterized protein n=1 Tax=Radiomyces spectabilis TaxID=64574 RepID=UPI0022206BFF|nr:uncharacterized protein BYT42DRAFT_556023 [Radiomyces spectabilis]KAI8391202.1 hypothetical protein BYT42DRAFT_556023 [Radiomyces spectabilis]